MRSPFTAATGRGTRLAAGLTALAFGLTACGGDTDATTASTDVEANGAAATDDMSEMASDDHDDMMGDHAHSTFASSLDLDVALAVTADAKAGWNVHIEPTGFTWAPQNANTEVVDGEGHAHLYIDGEKWGRVYTPWLHVNPDLAPGPHEFRVTLNANDHSDYAVDDEVVAAVMTVEVPESDDMAMHPHDEMFATEGEPTVALEVLTDAKMGVNVHVTTTGFTWAPEHASSEAIDGEGHAHLYLDGEKVGRLYGEWFHIGQELTPGEHEVRVTLNANDHRDYSLDGEPVAATVTFTVEG